MAGREEHRISIPGRSVGPESDKEDSSSLPSVLNVDEWIGEMESKIERAITNSTTPWPLYFEEETEDKICELTLRERISQRTSETKEGLSQPSVVTIGPFHRRDRVRISNYDKWVIVGLMNLLCGLDLASCLVKIYNQVPKARSRYNLDELERFGFEDEKRFAKMLLLDSYFILFTLTIKLRKGLAGYTLIPTTPNPARWELFLFRDFPFKFLDIICDKEEIVPDLLILDNQIPFFVIEELFEELKPGKPLFVYALPFFETIHPRPYGRSMYENTPPKFLHLLHLFHWSRVPQNKYIELITVPPKLLGCFASAPNAMELRESATVFEKRTSGSSMDIKFQRRNFKGIIGVLDIPELHIRDYSSLIFYNLIAFEMQSSTRGRCTMAFSALISNLLQSEEDVKLLRQSGILVSSSMTDRQLVDLFIRLSRLTENHQMPIDLFEICDQVLSYHKDFVSRFFRFIILWYFPNPQATFFVFVAVLLFVPTLLQTIYTMLSNYHR